mmetsp:Transcript_46024/g.134056  ORF Transcript_46024/g.134056 Transcript_46024/m.134056 type:complete len:99 (-) Transcript_46024:18-314(-)
MSDDVIRYMNRGAPSRDAKTTLVGVIEDDESEKAKVISMLAIAIITPRHAIIGFAKRNFISSDRWLLKQNLPRRESDLFWNKVYSIWIQLSKTILCVS